MIDLETECQRVATNLTHALATKRFSYGLTVEEYRQLTALFSEARDTLDQTVEYLQETT